MTSILSHHSKNATKLMLIGESGMGKTGSLASLVLAGYKLRIIDLDNGLDILKNLLTDPASSYTKQVQALGIDLNEAVQYVTITERMKNVNGKMGPAAATVWPRTMDMLTSWKEYERDPETGKEVKGTDGKRILVNDLGVPGDWGPDTVLVIDSLSRLSLAAMNYQQALNGQLGTDISSKGYEMRTDIRLGQAQIRKMLELLYAEEFHPNVVIISHIMYKTPEGQAGEAFGKKGYPETLGAALSPQVGKLFNNILQCVTVGSGQSEKHKIVTDTWGGVAAKTSAPSRVKSEYPIETGLADFFKAVRG